MKKTITIIGLAAAISLTGAFAQQSALNAGDLAIVQVSADTPDTFAFTSLVDITAGTFIHFADIGRTGTGNTYGEWRAGVDGRLGEGYYTWVASTNIAAGTVIAIEESVHLLGFSATGDNLLAFQGTVYNPNFLYGAGWAVGTPWISVGSPTTNNSYLPASLTLSTTATALGTQDNYSYNGSLTGTAGTILTNVGNAANYANSDAAPLPATPGNFTVTTPGVATEATTKVMGYNFGTGSAGYTASATVVAENTTLSTMVLNGTGVASADGGDGNIERGFKVDGGFSTSATFDINSDQYISFTLTMDPGYEFDLNQINFGYRRNADGPQSLALYMSNNGFTTSMQLGSDLSLASTDYFTFGYTDVSADTFSGTLEFRLFGWNAVSSSATGDLHFDEMWVQGTVIPEPSTWVLVGLGLSALIARRKLAKKA